MNFRSIQWSAWLLLLLGLSWVQPAQAQTVVKYIHTDALGSVVAVTDEAGNVIERREYEPYGAQLTPAVQDGPGYTGHVQDAATGLTYMQQRYYDAGIGRFLSVDPVTAHQSGDMRYFNRYAYAFNNPYSFKDPDGRCNQLINGLVGGLPCELQQRNLNPAHVAADKAVARDGYLVALPMITPAAGIAVAEAGPMAAVSATRAVDGIMSDKGRTILCLVLSCKTVDPAKPRDVTGEIKGKPTARVVEALRRRAEQSDRSRSISERRGESTRGSSGRDGGGFQGVFRVEGRIDARRLDRELKGN